MSKDENWLSTRVKERVDALEIKAVTASTQAHLGRDYIRDLIVGRSKSVRGDKLMALADVLQCDPRYLTDPDFTTVAAPDPSGIFAGLSPKEARRAKRVIAVLKEK